MFMKTIAVTGGSGKAGRATIKELLSAGYAVRNIDMHAPAEHLCEFARTDLNQLGETIEAMHGCDAVVHLAANPDPRGRSEEVMFRTNTGSTYNVFRAAQVLNMPRVVWASSETVLGLPFDRRPPASAPATEETIAPESSYALSKLVSEEMARQFASWSGATYVGLRFSNIMEPHDYARFEGWQNDPHARKWNFWGYVDARDVAQSCRLGLESTLTGAEVFVIAAADTCMRRSNADLMAEVFPHIQLTPGLGDNETLLSISKARRMLGYNPKHSWRD
jgi:nucleoside-diphosphate-sugar epimerase